MNSISSNSASIRAGLYASFIFASMMLIGPGCSGDDDALVVEICGDLGVPEEIDSVRIAVLDAQRQALRAGVRELLECPGDHLRPLPQQVSFQPLETEGWVVVTGLRDEVEVIRYERRINVEERDVNPIIAVLSRDCLGFQCPLGQTCMGGRCQVVSTSVTRGSCPSALSPVADELDAGDVEESDASFAAPSPRYCPAPDTGIEDEAS